MGARAKLVDTLATWIAIGGGVGLIPFAPGSFGTLLAIPLLLIGRLADSSFVEGSVAILVILLGIWASHRYCSLFGKKDPPQIVIDEIAGFLVAVLFIPLDWVLGVIGFLLFRFFDIAKIPPALWVERKIKGGLGIVLDDLVAGLYVQLLLRLLLAFHIFSPTPHF